MAFDSRVDDDRVGAVPKEVLVVGHGRLKGLTHPLGLPGAWTAGQDLLYGAGVGRSAGQGEAHELRPVDRKRRAGVRIRLPLTRTVSLTQSWVPSANHMVPSTYGT